MPQSSGLVISLFMTLVCVVSCVRSEDEFIIERKSEDTFTIPDSICANDIQKQCHNMGGSRQESEISTETRCKCQCSSRKLFGFFNNTWKCERNHDVRRLVGKGCYVKLSGIDLIDSPIDVVPASQWKQFIVPALTEYCVLKRNFSFFDCNGQWQQIQNARNGFLLENRGIEGYFLRSYEETDFNLFFPTLQGKIINLRISCLDNDYCVVLKVKGKLKCPFTKPITLTPTYPGSVDGQSTIKSPLPHAHDKDNSGVIAGAVGGVVFLVVLVVMIVLLVAIKRKRSRNILNDHEPETSNSALDNPSYKRGEGHILTVTSQQDDQEEYPYSYARHRDHPIINDDYQQAKAGNFPCGGKERKDQINKTMEESNTEENKGSQLSLLNEPNYNGLEHTSFPSFPLDYEVPVSSKHVSDCNKTQTSQNMNSSANEGHSPTSDAPVYNTLQDPDYEKLQSSEDMYNLPTNNVNESKIQGQLSQDSSSNREAPAYSTLEDPDYEKLRKEQDMYSVPSNDPQGNKSTVEENQTSSGSLPNQDFPVYSSLENPDYERLREHPTSDKQRSAGPPPNYKAPVYSTLDDPDYEKLKITQGIHEVPYNSGNDSKSITGDIQQSPTSPVYSTLEDSNYEKFDEPMTPAVQEGRSSPVPPPNYDAPVYQEDGHYKRLQRSQDTHDVSSIESEDKIPTSPVYSTLEDVHHYERVQKVQDMHERPAYNILERPETKWKTLQGPVYEVPKDPKSATNSLRNPVRSEYNTLDHPANRRSKQLKEMHSEVSYNVLDRPEAKWASKKKTNSEEPKSSGGHVYEVI